MELSIIRWIQQFASNGLDQFFEIMTQFGEENLYIAIITYLYWNVDKKFGKVLGFATCMTLIINNSLKELFNFDRPIGEEGIRSLRLETATGKAFPSGHTQSASTFYTMLGLRVDNRLVKSLCAAIIFVVGLSRVYLGVHYPKDVISAWVIGVLIATTVFFVVYKHKKALSIYFAGVGAGILLLSFIGSEDYYKSLGLLIGFAIACYIEEMYVNFSTESRLSKKIIRFIIGVLILILIKSVLKVVFPHHMVF